VSYYRLSRDDFGVTHYESIMRMVDYLMTWDLLDLPNVVGVEVMLRQAQLYEYMYAMEYEARDSGASTAGPTEGEPKAKAKGKPKSRGGGGFLKFGFVDEVGVITGTAREDGRMMVAPALLEHVAKQVERDAGILKQIRKAKEERRALAP
jgi:hypothetical protein